MSTISKPEVASLDEEAASLDEHRPGWLTVGRSNAGGICDDLIAAVGEVAQGLALIAVVLPARDSQPEIALGKLRGQAVGAIPLRGSGILEAASSGVGAPIWDAIRHSLAAELRLAVVRAVPLDTPEARIGLLIVGWDSSAHPVAGDLARLSGLCEQAALAITNLTLRCQLARAERSKRDADALVAAASDLTSCQSSSTLHSRIVSHAKDLAGAQLAYLALFDEEHQDLVVATTAGERSSLLTGMRIPLNEGFAAQAVRNRATLTTSDLMTDARRRPAWEQVRLAEDIHGSIWTPIFAGERLLGLLQVANRHVTQFTDDETRLLQRLADIAAVAMQNARAHEQQQHANVELARLSQINVARCSEAQCQASVTVALASALWSSKGLDALAAALAGRLNNPVVICNQSFNVLASKRAAGSDATDGDPALAEALAHPDSSLAHTLARLQRRSHPARVALPGAEGTSISYVAAPIIVDKTHVGYLLVSESPGPLQESDWIMLEHAIPFFAAEFRRRTEVGQARESLGGDLLLDLLHDGMSEHCVNQARLLPFGLDEQYAVAIFHAGSDLTQVNGNHGRKGAESAAERLLAAVRAEFQSPSYSIGPVLSAVKDGFVVALAPSDLRADQWKGMVGVLAARFPNSPVTVSISEPFQGIAGVQVAFRKNLWMLRSAIQLGRVGRVVTSDELGVYRLLAEVNRPEDLVEFARDALGRLLDEGPKHNPDLLPTLDAYLRSTCRLHETAKSLFIHPHTLRYRINRIEEILGHSVNDPAWREEAQLALAIARVQFPELLRSA